MAKDSWSGPVCPKCGAALDPQMLTSEDQVCQECLHPFVMTLFTPAERRVAVRRLEEAGPEGAVPCAVHAGNAAVGNCTRCGVFQCALCRIAIDDQELCPGCFDRLTSERALSSARAVVRDFRSLALFTGLAGLLLVCFGLLTGPLTLFFAFKASQQRRRWQERGGGVSIALAVVMGLAQIGLSLFVLIIIITPLFAAAPR